jgi:hypothetical protein
MAQLGADGYPTATAHDPIVEIFPDVYLLRGSYRTNGIIQFNRNMVILRHQGELALLNAVRLSPEGEVQLDALGQVKHLLRLGYLHGMDDLCCRAKQHLHSSQLPLALRVRHDHLIP